MIAYVLAYAELFISAGLFFYYVEQYEVSGMLLAGLLMAVVYGLSSVLWMHYRREKNL
jgi:low temperature requirement protein LtrA